MDLTELVTGRRIRQALRDDIAYWELRKEETPSGLREAKRNWNDHLLFERYIPATFTLVGGLLTSMHRSGTEVNWGISFLFGAAVSYLSAHSDNDPYIDRIENRSEHERAAQPETEVIDFAQTASRIRKEKGSHGQYDPPPMSGG